MDVARLQDRFYWGLNRAANVMGVPSDAYRPTGASNPLDRTNRYLRLNAAFSRVDGRFDHTPAYGEALWRGHFDASYTRAGDYLVNSGGIWFIASQYSLLPVLCVKTNRIISITRPANPVTASASVSSTPTAAIPLMSRWPASVLGIRAEGKSPTRLPGDTMVANMVALLPSSHNQVLQVTDLITDDLGETSVIVTTELTDFGWRLNVRRVTT